MTDTKETIQQAAQVAYETQQTITRSAVAAQERNTQFAQETFEQGVNVLKGHVEVARQRLQQPVQEPQKALQVALDDAAEAYKRNAEYALSVLENGIATFKSHVEESRTLAQTLAERTQEQLEAFQDVPAFKMYSGLFSAYLTAYKQASEATQTLTEQTLHFTKQTTRQNLELTQKVSQEFRATALAALRQE